MTCQAYAAGCAIRPRVAAFAPRLPAMRASRAWLACLLLLPVLGCEADARKDPSPALPERSAPAGTDESLRDGALALVEQREQALQAGDRDAFLATIDAGAADFAETQARWFDNLADLPVTDVSYELGDEGVMTRISGAGDLQLPVDFTMRLDGFDRKPVTQHMVWTFVGDRDEVLLANDRNLQIDAMNGWTPAPWDVTDIDVRRRDGVLAVFDAWTVEDADEVMSDLTAAAGVVRDHVPSWSGRFVAYDITDVDAIDSMSAMLVEETAGVAFGIPTGRGGGVASYRFAVNPIHVGDPWSRSLVFRHELTHVALGTRDDRSPTWLVEGVAEHVAESVLSGQERRWLAEQALGTGDVDATLEPSRKFYTRDPDRSYALAAVVCDYLAATRGEQVLWDLVDTFRTARFAVWTETDDIVRRELGTSTRDLARDALAWSRAA